MRLVLQLRIMRGRFPSRGMRRYYAVISEIVFSLGNRVSTVIPWSNCDYNVRMCFPMVYKV